MFNFIIQILIFIIFNIHLIDLFSKVKPLEKKTFQCVFFLLIVIVKLLK